MDPKINIKEAAEFLETSARQIYKTIQEYDLPHIKQRGTVYFGYPTAQHIFKIKQPAQAISFQIVKGGTGKTSLACSCAVRANLYGLKVLCIDMDQQGNLSHSFGVDAESVPVMIDILADGYTFREAIVKVMPGLDIIASRIENALLDDAIKLRKLPLSKVYAPAIARLKKKYDLIIIDCPPNLGQSVAAITLGVDKVIAPVVAENYALSGLKNTSAAIAELEETYNQKISWEIAINKFDNRTVLSQDALQMLAKHPRYKDHLLKSIVRSSQEFPNAIAKGQSIFDNLKSTTAKTDIDSLIREILGLSMPSFKPLKERQVSTESFAESLA